MNNTKGGVTPLKLRASKAKSRRGGEEAVKRVGQKSGTRYKDFQVGFSALNKSGETGSYCIHEGFSYQVYKENENKNYKSEYFNKS